jgi:ubiquinone/menaquinone biosynthesis C-methylase UbiE
MIEQLIHRIKVRQAELQISLAAGTAMTWEAYQRMVGEHQGLQTTMDMIDSMLEEEKNRD